MIPQAYITEWSSYVPWQTNEQVEQDLVICRALVEIFKDKFLSENLAFRGGTALHKLYLSPQPRYSEDIDLVQITPGTFGEVLDRLKEVLSFIDGKINVNSGESMTTLRYRFDSEIPPTVKLKLKIETNCREHFTELGWQKHTFSVKSEWYTGECNITTYKLEELLGTKLRALYQRRKGRDLYDLYKAFTQHQLDTKAILKCYNKYMEFSVSKAPSQKEFMLNIEEKMINPDFIGDIKALIRPEEKYDPETAFELVKTELFDKMS
jgi:predicted nucleotidyltransferase component of viral defense system